MELPALALGAEKSVYHITCTGVDSLQIIGTSLTIALNGFNLDLLGDYDFFSFTFGEGDSSATFNLADLAVTAVYGDQTYTGYSETQDGTTTLYFGNPEATQTALFCCEGGHAVQRAGARHGDDQPAVPGGARVPPPQELNWSFPFTLPLMPMVSS